MSRTETAFRWRFLLKIERGSKFLSMALLMFACVARTLAAPSPLVISEFAAAGRQHLRDEDGDTPDWIEIQNRSANSVNLSGWTLTEQPHHRKAWPFPARELPAGQFLTVFASGKDRRPPEGKLHANFKLPSEGGTLILRGPAGETSRIDNYPPQVSGVTFGLSIKPNGEGSNAHSGSSPGEGSSQEAGAESYFYLAAPTPGISNSPAVCTGPRVEWLRHEPSILQTNEPLRITAKVIGIDTSVKEVRLVYRVMFGNELELPMLDDGEHGDGAKGDGVYGAEVPAGAAKAGQILRYCVVCQDQSGNSSRWPLFANRTGYSSYQGTVVADSSVHTRLPVLELFNSKSQRSQRANATSAVAFFDGELYDNIGLAVHGQISRGFPKQSYNLHFPHDHLLRWQTNQARVKGMTLMSNYADKSKIRNTLAYEMIAASGSLGHFAFPVRVQMNGRFFSIAEMVEKGGERWLERVHLDPQGALYKMNNPLTGAGGAEKKSREFEDARDLASFARALSEQRPIEERAIYAYSHLDLPQCISYLVAMNVISSDDHGHKNYYLYRDSRHSREWSLLPWDVDLSWGRNWTGEYFNETMFVDNPLDLYRNGRNKARNRLYNLLLQYPDFRQMYLRRLRTVMDDLLQPPGTPPGSLIIEKRIREWMDQIDPPDIKPSDAALDQKAWPSWGDPRSAREEAQRIIKEYLPGRRQFLFKSAKAKLAGDAIPESQNDQVAVSFAGISSNVPREEQFICLTNKNAVAVDVSDWTVAGGGIEYRLRPGTVLPAGKSLTLLASIDAFRRKTMTESTPLFVQGNWKGNLDRSKGPLTLTNRRHHEVAREGN